MSSKANGKGRNSCRSSHETTWNDFSIIDSTKSQGTNASTCSPATAPKCLTLAVSTGSW